MLTVDVFRVPEGVAWPEVESDCANGVWRPGDIEMVDRRHEPGSADQPCFRVQWTNGLKLRWEGCDQLAYPDQPRYRRFRILGVFAARAIVGRGAWHSGGAARVLGEVGWYTEACTLAERALRWSRAKPGGEIPQEILAGVMSGLPPDWQAKFHERMVVETINAVRQAQEDGDGFLQHRATYALVALGQHVPTGSSAAAFVRRVRDSGVLDVENLTKVLRHLRAALVAERAYVDALEDGVAVARRIFALTGKDRGRLMSHAAATVAAIHLLDLLPSNPIVTVPRAAKLLGTTAPTARKAVEVLERIGVLRETSGKQRDRVYAYQAYLQALTADEGRG